MSLYLGNTPIANTGYDKANIDLSNLTSTGKNIANWSNNVTNCITEIPQDIKLELNSNNRPVLKAGSKFYRPNGNGVFDLVSNTSDLTFNFTNTQTGKYFLCVTGNNSAGWAQVGLTGSGTSTEANNGFYYRTDDNKIYYQNNSSGNAYSFPLAIVTATKGVCVIDQVFNGFGYIGSTIFALPGVKGLSPNYRNADGTLKNTEVQLTKVCTYTRKDKATLNLSIVPDNIYGTGAEYSPEENVNKFTDGSPTLNRVLCGSVSWTSNGITSFTPKTTFHALDYNDSSTISGWSMPSSRYVDLTLGASNASYTAPANGWFVVAKIAGISGSYINAYNSDFRHYAIATSQRTTETLGFMVPVKSGDSVTIAYNATGSTMAFKFVYAEGEQ